MELADPVGVPSDVPVGGDAGGVAAFVMPGGRVFAAAVAVVGGAPVTAGGRCSIMSSASARLVPIPSGEEITPSTPLVPGAGVATTPHDRSSTSFTGQRNRSDNRQLTSCGT